EVFKECETLGRLGTDLVFSVRAGYGIRDELPREGPANLVGPPTFIADQIARYADVGVSHIVLEARMRDLGEHLTLLHRFAQANRPRTEAWFGRARPHGSRVGQGARSLGSESDEP